MGLALLALATLSFDCFGKEQLPQQAPIAEETPSDTETNLREVAIPAVVVFNDHRFAMLVDRNNTNDMITVRCPYSRTDTEYTVEELALEVEKVTGYDQADLKATLLKAFVEASKEVRKIPSRSEPSHGRP
jgi:hypothetical protein